MTISLERGECDAKLLSIYIRINGRDLIGKFSFSFSFSFWDTLNGVALFVS